MNVHEATPAAHDYVSTACFHGQHEHCRLTCKFCAVRCACACHPWNPLHLSPELLERAFQNTVELLKREVIVDKNAV